MVRAEIQKQFELTLATCCVKEIYKKLKCFCFSHSSVCVIQCIVSGKMKGKLCILFVVFVCFIDLCIRTWIYSYSMLLNGYKVCTGKILVGSFLHISGPSWMSVNLRKKEQEKYLLIGTEQASSRKSLLLIKS